MKEIVIDTLNVISKFVEDFETLLVDKYNLDDIPYNEAGQAFPRSGQVSNKDEIFSYRFHGSGCRLETANTVLEYIISPITENKIKITPRDLMIFMKSCRKEEVVQKLISKDMHLLFNELEQEGFLRKRPESVATYEIVKDAIEKWNSRSSN